MPVRRDVPRLARGGVRFWAPFLLIAVAGACVGLSMRARPIPVSAHEAVTKAADRWKGMQMETSRLDDRHLWIIIRVPAGPRQPARTIRYDAYRQVLSHYRDARKIPLSFTIAPLAAAAGSGL